MMIFVVSCRAFLILTLFVLACINQVARCSTGCPPDSGIYLMHHGNCYPNGSYFFDNIIRNFDNLQLVCALQTGTVTGEWIGPNGEAVNCSIDSLRCTTESSPAKISLYITFGEFLGESNDGLYTCCLPTNCSDPNTNRITANMFVWAQITDVTVDLPSDMTVLPQQYTIHAIKSGAPDEEFLRSATWYYESGGDRSSTNLTTLCNEQQSEYNCTVGNGVLLHSFNGSYDYTLTVIWSGESIADGYLWNPSINNGDHEYRFNLQLGIDNYYVNRNRSITITAPGFSPSSLTVVYRTFTTISVSWNVSDPSDASGYVVNATSRDHTVTLQVEGGSQRTATLEGLKEATMYNISVRAYQQIMGPASGAISVSTFPEIPSSPCKQKMIEMACETHRMKNLNLPRVCNNVKFENICSPY